MGSLPARARIEASAARALMRLPRGLLVRMTGGNRRYADGQVLDEQLQLVLYLFGATGRKHTHEMSVAEARKDTETSAMVFAPAPRETDRIEDRTIDSGLRVRVYRPRDLPAAAPAVVFFHGGGFVVGSLDSHDPQCRAIAADTGSVVVAVDYRLAPEHPFPAAADDATAAFRWVIANAASLGVDRSRVAVMGDSAGGNLAAVVSLDTRGDAIRPCLQVLVYPAVDLTRSFASHRTFERGYFLEKETMDWFLDRYAPRKEDHENPRASPLFAESHAGLPRAFVQTAGFDPLRDEGEAYAEKLEQAGVPVERRRYASLIHGFFNMCGTIEAAHPAMRDAVDALRRAFTMS